MLGLAGEKPTAPTFKCSDGLRVNQKGHHLASFSIQHLFFLTNNLCEIALLSNLAYFSTSIFSQVSSASQVSFVFFFLATIVNIIVSGYSSPLFLTMWQSLDGIETNLQ